MEDTIFDKVEEMDLEEEYEGVVHRLCHERYHRACTSGREGRSETGAAKNRFMHMYRT